MEEINNKIHNITYKLLNKNNDYILLNKAIVIINDVINNNYDGVDYIMLNKLLLLIRKHFEEKDYISLVNNSLDYINKYFHNLFNKTLLYEHMEKYITCNDYIKILLLFGNIIKINDKVLNYLNILLYHNISTYSIKNMLVISHLYYYITDDIVDYIDDTMNKKCSINKQILSMIYTNIIKNICYIMKYINMSLVYSSNNDYFIHTLKPCYNKLYKTIYNLNIIISIIKYNNFDHQDINNIIKIMNYLYPYNFKHKDIDNYVYEFNIIIFNEFMEIIKRIIYTNNQTNMYNINYLIINEVVKNLLNRIIVKINDISYNSDIDILFENIDYIIAISEQYISKRTLNYFEELEEYEIFETKISDIIGISNDKLNVLQKHFYKINYIKDNIKP